MLAAAISYCNGRRALSWRNNARSFSMRFLRAACALFRLHCLLAGWPVFEKSAYTSGKFKVVWCPRYVFVIVDWREVWKSTVRSPYRLMTQLKGRWSPKDVSANRFRGLPSCTYPMIQKWLWLRWKAIKWEYCANGCWEITVVAIISYAVQRTLIIINVCWSLWTGPLSDRLYCGVQCEPHSE
jgi:hypothetical protein